MEKLPPKEKIIEAWTAIADHHVDMGQDHATVLSSNGEKRYTVSWDADTYTSNDNATYWRGYAGYPIIAVLMLQGRVPLDTTMADRFADVDWNAINKLNKGKYAAAVAQVVTDRGLDPTRVDKAVATAYDVLAQLPLTIKRSRLPTTV